MSLFTVPCAGERKKHLPECTVDSVLSNLLCDPSAKTLLFCCRILMINNQVALWRIPPTQVAIANTQTEGHMNTNYYNKAVIITWRMRRIREGRGQFSFGGWIQGRQPHVVNNPLSAVKMLSWKQCPLVPCSSDQAPKGCRVKWHFGIMLWTTIRLEIGLVCSRLQLLNSFMKN